MFREFFGSLVSLLRRGRQPAPQQHERDVEQGTMTTEDTFRSVDQNINQQDQQQQPPQPMPIQQQRFHIGKPINTVTDPSAAVIQTINTNTADDDHYCLNSFNKKYRMVHILGSGGYGFVWSGYQITNRFEVAIKVVRGIKAVDENNDRIIPKEVQLMQAVANVPGVIRLLYWYLVEGNLYIVMEQPERAIDMYDYLRDWIVLSEDKARDMFRQVVQSVVGCYKLGIVHCDVKDQNLLVARNSNETTLIDFGSGYFVHELAGLVPFKGTRIHAPPEFIEFKRYLAIPATVWSLGTLLFTMVFRRPPFVNDDEILEAKVEFPRVISPDCGSLIRKLLTRDPNKRITLEAILEEDWFKADNSSGKRPLVVGNRPVNPA